MSPRIGGTQLTFCHCSGISRLLNRPKHDVAPLLNFKKEERGAVTVMTTFTNISMMGIPMVYSLYGHEAMCHLHHCIPSAL